MTIDSRGFLHCIQRESERPSRPAVCSVLPSRAALHKDDIYDVSLDNGHTSHRIVTPKAMLRVRTVHLVPAACGLLWLTK